MICKVIIAIVGNLIYIDIAYFNEYSQGFALWFTHNSRYSKDQLNLLLSSYVSLTNTLLSKRRAGDNITVFECDYCKKTAQSTTIISLNEFFVNVIGSKNDDFIEIASCNLRQNHSIEQAASPE